MATISPRITAPLCLATKREKERQGERERVDGGGCWGGGRDRSAKMLLQENIYIHNKMAVLHGVCTASKKMSTQSDKGLCSVNLKQAKCKNVKCDSWRSFENRKES